jgi:hypothetical protein
MSTGTLSIIILLVVVFGLLGFGIVFSFIKRGQYLKEVQGKIKCVFFPQAGATYNKVVDVDLSGHEIAAPKDKSHPHILPRYYFDKENTWYTKYPESPFLGLSYLQVQIATVWYFENNPEPVTSQAIEEPHVATASMIFASIDSAFALVVHELDAELQKTKKQLLDALSTKLNKTVVYFCLIVIVFGILLLSYKVFTDSSYIHSIGKSLGVK